MLTVASDVCLTFLVTVFVGEELVEERTTANNNTKSVPLYISLDEDQFVITNVLLIVSYSCSIRLYQCNQPEPWFFYIYSMMSLVAIIFHYKVS